VTAARSELAKQGKKRVEKHGDVKDFRVPLNRGNLAALGSPESVKQQKLRNNSKGYRKWFGGNTKAGA